MSRTYKHPNACGRAKCGLCHWHKHIGNAKDSVRASHRRANVFVESPLMALARSGQDIEWADLFDEVDFR